MKNRFSLILGIVTALFFFFTLGIFLGKSVGGADVYISEAVPDAPAISATIPPTALQTSAPTEPITFPIDINTATAEMLQHLPGIGPILAQRIVDYRETNGPFLSPGELTRVEGIGQIKLEDILHLITIQEEDTQ